MRTVHLYEPVITDEESKDYGKWLSNPTGSFPYKFTIKTYSKKLGKKPRELFTTLCKSKNCEMCNYYKENK